MSLPLRVQIAVLSIKVEADYVLGQILSLKLALGEAGVYCLVSN